MVYLREADKTILLTTIISTSRCFNNKWKSYTFSIRKSNAVFIGASEDIQQSRTHLKDRERTEAATLPNRECLFFSSSSSSSSSFWKYGIDEIEEMLGKTQCHRREWLMWQVCFFVATHFRCLTMSLSTFSCLVNYRGMFVVCSLHYSVCNVSGKDLCVCHIPVVSPSGSPTHPIILKATWLLQHTLSYWVFAVTGDRREGSRCCHDDALNAQQVQMKMILSFLWNFLF